MNKLIWTLRWVMSLLERFSNAQIIYSCFITKAINAVFLFSRNLSFIYSYLLDNIYTHPVQFSYVNQAKRHPYLAAKSKLNFRQLILNNLKVPFP